MSFRKDFKYRDLDVLLSAKILINIKSLKFDSKINCSILQIYRFLDQVYSTPDYFIRIFTSLFSLCSNLKFAPSQIKLTTVPNLYSVDIGTYL